MRENRGSLYRETEPLRHSQATYDAGGPNKWCKGNRVRRDGVASFYSSKWMPLRSPPGTIFVKGRIGLACLIYRLFPPLRTFEQQQHIFVINNIFS